jgi:sulfonate transport system ATP-binding protein
MSVILPTNDGDLAITALNKNFVIGRESVPALRDIDLHVRQGEFICIVGGSGCGKSTLLRIVAGLERQYDGRVLLSGRSVGAPGPDRGLVFQEPRLLPWLTVWKNIAFGLEHLPVGEKRQTIEEHVALVGLAGFEHAYPHQLSGGMAQRTAIARAIVNRPKVLLMDEPFGALDALTRVQMQTELLRIWQSERVTVILVTHDIDEAIYLGDRVLVMSNRPGTVQKAFEVDLPRPRDRTGTDFVGIRKAVLKEFFAEEASLLEYVI